ncbi:hypothetical protein BKA91DRAFT_11518 [Yarrowia lipolytica]|uniref:Uncharacterized protein n=1 Tax=Yarrowia lipolytica TaxID=4952 RepID=A0A1D8NBJ2_YARLL|nr:hypothetical protein YALI1_C24767g [Yarrowia lipolytica]KAB8283658.1 hypothetical protein BKA91DRAFT_11518 [Yarrowia lipolytica]KAE8172247.1 hypothetical protein BKA90DRAFT_19891 [Yarrowia lipolytica]
MVYAVIKTPDEAFREDDNAKQSIQTLRISSRTVSEMGFKNLIPRTGEYKVFPPGHFTKDLTKDLARYVRFSSASYGQSFMRLLGIGLFDVPFSTTAVHHSEHHTFAHHARVSLDQILLSKKCYSDKRRCILPVAFCWTIHCCGPRSQSGSSDKQRNLGSRRRAHLYVLSVRHTRPTTAFRDVPAA